MYSQKAQMIIPFAVLCMSCFASASMLGESDFALAMQSTSSGGLYRNGCSFYLDFHEMDQPIAIEDPTDPLSARQVNTSDIAATFPRFSVLMMNSSNTQKSSVPYVTLVLQEQVPSVPGTVTYKVDVMSEVNADSTPDQTNFTSAMLLIDLTEEGTLTPGQAPALENSKSLHWLMTNTPGLTHGLVPAASKDGEITAQGVFTTAFLGPFNAWAWICCAYKIPEHLIIGWVAPLSYVTLFLCCV